MLVKTIYKKRFKAPANRLQEAKKQKLLAPGAFGGAALA
jgi:hypothetical protein